MCSRAAGSEVPRGVKTCQRECVRVPSSGRHCQRGGERGALRCEAVATTSFVTANAAGSMVPCGVKLWQRRLGLLLFWGPERNAWAWAPAQCTQCGFRVS
eukprot:gene13735-biopygen5048